MQELLERFKETDDQRAKRIFVRAKRRGAFKVVNLDDITEANMNPMSVAEAIIKASEGMQKPVKVATPRNWGFYIYEDALILTALREQGYKALHQRDYGIINQIRYYWLEKAK